MTSLRPKVILLMAVIPVLLVMGSWVSRGWVRHGKDTPAEPSVRPFVTVLGTIQDGGSPHIGCKKSCCADLRLFPDTGRKVVCLGLTDPSRKKKWLFEATPDLPSQWHLLNRVSGFPEDQRPDGIFLTHAHIGHYSGLMYLGREALGTKNVPVYVLPRFKEFIESNGPWDQLVSLGNIQLRSISADQAVDLENGLTVTPFLVPHRDEYSETAGFSIQGPEKRMLFIPDINKWGLWNRSLTEEIRRSDYVLIDATFFGPDELPGRNMAEIPHPFVVETMELLSGLPAGEKTKVYFIHLNHSNPLLNKDSEAMKRVTREGFHVASFLQQFPL